MITTIARAASIGAVFQKLSRKSVVPPAGEIGPWTTARTVEPMPMKMTTRKKRKRAAVTKRCPVMAPTRIVNSLMNGPNGGEPVIARKPGEEEDGRQRDAAEGPAHGVDRLAPVRAVDVARGEEEDDLREGIVDDVQERAEDRDAAGADADDQDSHVLDARVREHPLEVALPDHERRRDAHGEKPEGEKELARERPFSGRLHDPVDPEEREERAVRHSAGEERPDDPRGLAVGVGLPGVHRREPHLRSVADEEEDEAGPEPRPRQAARVLEQGAEEKALVPGGAVERGVRHEERAQERERDPDRPDHEVLPRGLERAGVVVEVDEDRRRERRPLDRDPDDRQVLRHGDRRRHRQEREEADAEDAVRPLLADPQVLDAVERAEREEDGHDVEDQMSERVDCEPASERRVAGPHGERADQVKHGRAGDDQRSRLLRGRHEHHESGEERHGR